MTFVLGLTGSIGMGKSTTAQMFVDEGIPLWDADAAVRELYAPNGRAAKVVMKHYPEAMEGDAVSRPKLRGLIAEDPKVLDHLQSLVHPLVAAHRQNFLSVSNAASIVVLDIPLLFEIGANADCDGVVVVTAPKDVQRSRVLSRGEMSEQDFELILRRQIPDSEKRAKATWVIETLTLEAARASVRQILNDVETGLSNA